jgi:type VI protein secretion system component VasK
VLGNPWLAVGIVIGLLLVCAWIGWAIHVGSEHGSREALGVLIVWPAIVAVLAVISIPFVWAFRVIRASAGSDEREAETESGDAEATETG